MGIDQSYRMTGYCILDNGDIIACGIITSDEKKDIFERAYKITIELGEIYKTYHPDVVGLEGLSFSSKGNVTRNLGGLQFLIMVHFRYTLNANIEIVPPTTIKKFAVKGNAKKEELFNALPLNIKKQFEKMFKKSKGRYDVTDAYWIAKYITETKNANS